MSLEPQEKRVTSLDEIFGTEDNEDDSSSIDIDLELEKTEKRWSIKLMFTTFMGILTGLWLASKNFWTRGPSNLGIVDRSKTMVSVLSDDKIYKVFFPRTLRSFPRSLGGLATLDKIEVYKPRGEIDEVMVRNQDIDQVWTKEFLELSGPNNNFFGIPVTLRTIWPSENLSSEIQLIIRMRGHEEKIFGIDEIIDIYHWHEVSS